MSVWLLLLMVVAACVALWQVADLKSMVDDFLRSNDVYAQIRTAIEDHSKRKADGEVTGGADIFDVIEEQGIVDEILDSLET